MSRSAVVAVQQVARVVLLLAAVSACGVDGDRAARSQRPPASIGPIPQIVGANVLVLGSRETRPDVSSDAVASLGRADAAFALDLYRELAGESDENLVLGPHSISSALAMVYAGARGATATEMAQVLHYGDLPGELTPLLNALDLALASRNEEGAVDLRLANQLFAQPDLPLLDSYLTTLTHDFGAPLAELEFGDPEAARDVINGWAADRTNGKITELFPPGAITPATALVLCNAISMDAAWTYLFDPKQTTDEPFHLPDGRVVAVPTMRFDLYLPLAYEHNYQAVELPYGSGDLSMVVILPEHMDAFERDLDPDRLDQVFDAISDQGIHLLLPKFSFKSHVALDETLQRMGIRRAYDGSAADFSGMTGGRDLWLDTVQHEAFIEVDEDGTEAHAATGAAMASSHGPTITVDRPFFFVIRDRPTGAILFVGRVMDPSAS